MTRITTSSPHPPAAVQATLGQMGAQLAAHADSKINKLSEKIDKVYGAMQGKHDDLHDKLKQVAEIIREFHDEVNRINNDIEKDMRSDFDRVDTELNSQFENITDVRKRCINSYHEFTKLRDQVKEMGVEVKEMRDVLKKMKTQMATRADLTAAFSKLRDLHIDVSSAKEPQPRLRLPDPTKLASPDDLRVWIVEMQNKLAIDGGVIGSPEVQVYYVFAYLNPEAQKIAVAALKVCREDNHWDYEAIFKLLVAFYK
ncbi:hypothetical protein K449DRAFT_81510 [Hypoxylon sp. EC38]|nr:hypothetical protein K449DRAFT_81510 [Hypoxylon sp. EC38]